MKFIYLILFSLFVTSTNATVIFNDGVATTLMLSDTGVTPGSYTAADITVDAQGRISMAANGAGGSGETNTASNLGTGSGVFASKVGVDLRFKSLVAGTGITLTPSSTEILIDSSGGGITWATPVDSNIIPDTNAAYEIGSTAFPFDTVYNVGNYVVDDSNSVVVSTFEVFGGTLKGFTDVQSIVGVFSPSDNGNINTFKNLMIYAHDEATADASQAGSIIVRGGDKTAGTGDGGDVIVAPGVGFGGGVSGQIISKGDFIGDTGSAWKIETKDEVTTSQDLKVYTGEAATTGNIEVTSGYGTVASGSALFGSGQGGGGAVSGPATFKSGDCDSVSGIVTVASGDTINQGNPSGEVFVQTGAVTDETDSGDVSIKTATVNSTANLITSGDLNFTTGNATGVNGNSGNINLTPGTASGVRGSVIIDGEIYGKWVKYTKTFTDFSTAALTNSLVLFSLPAGSTAEVIVHHTAAFTGGGASAANLFVETDDAVLISGVDGFAAPTDKADSANDVSSTYPTINFSTNRDMRVRLDADVNLDQLTTGSVDIYIKYTTLP